MPKDNWWLNRAGRFAQHSSNRNVPAYGLTMDVATAPWDEPSQFDALITSRRGVARELALTAARNIGNGDGEGVGSAVSQALLATTAPAAGLKAKELEAAFREGQEAFAESQADGNWFSDSMGAVGDAGSWAKDTAQSGIERVPGGESALDVADTAITGKWSPIYGDKVAPARYVVDSALYGYNKINESGATLVTAGAVAEDSDGNQWLNMFKGDTWSDAHEIVQTNHIGFGEAFVAESLSFGQENNIVTDTQRLNQLRQNSGWFNAAALLADVALMWKLDPTVVGGRILGRYRGFRRGDISIDPKAGRLQRDILASATRGDAQAKARQQASLTDRLDAKRGLTLWDRMEDVREAARTKPREDFLNMTPFHRDVNGRTMGDLILEVADDEPNWNRVKRLLVGDATVIDELRGERGEIVEKINAIEGNRLPSLHEELSILQSKKDNLDLEDWYVQLGDPEKEKRILSGAVDWLDEPIKQTQAKIDGLKTQLSTYKDHDDWYNRALAGIGSGNELTSAGGQSNAVFGAMETIGTSTPLGSRALKSKVFRDDRDRGKRWREENPTTSIWQSSFLSPVSTFTRVPRSWFLKSNHIVNFHETDRSSRAISSWMDNLDALTGRTDIARRSEILDAYHKAGSENARMKVIRDLQSEGIRMVGQKYGLSDDLMKQFAPILQNFHSQGWQRLRENHFTSVELPDGNTADLVEWYQGRSLHRAQMPLSTAELENSERLVNLRDIDKAVRRNKDLLLEMGESLEWRTRVHGKAIATRRAVADATIASMEWFNHIWKPMALISFRWPLRVIGDENTRWSLLGLQGMAREATRGVGHIMYNQGVRAYEFGRKRPNGKFGMVKTNSLSDDAIRSANLPYDVADVKMVGNPSGVMPYDVADLDRVDNVRYRELGTRMAQREEDFAKEVTHRAQRGTPPAQRARWQQQVDDMIGEAERTGQGITLDPLTNKASRNGWATSVYPGRVRTLGEKPTAHDVRRFTSQNLDVLQNRRNRVGVWRDPDTGAWTIDIVRRHAARDTALKEASLAGVDHAYDVSNGFQRMVWDEDPLGNWRKNFKTPGATPLQMKKSGVGKVKVRSLDGKRVEFTDIYGPDPLNGNIFIESGRSTSAVEGYFGSGTMMEKQLNDAGMAGDFKTVTPDQNGWSERTAEYANRMIRKDAVWRRMLNGQTDNQLRGWLKSAEGRMYRERIDPDAMWDLDDFIDRKRQVLETQFAGDAIKLAMRDSNITPEQVEKLISEPDRQPIHGETINHLGGQSAAGGMWARNVQRMYKILGSKMSDAVTRHPMGAAMYRMKLQNLTARYNEGELTNSVMRGLESQARNFAIHQIRRYMFNMSDEFNGVRSFRFAAPFFNAQVEVLERYLRLIGDHPESLGKLLGVAQLSGGDHGPLMQTVDEEGNPTDNWSTNGYVTSQIPMDLIKHVPYFKKLADAYGAVPIPTASVNLILQGENPLMPGFGPIVTYPTSVAIKKTMGPEVYAKDWFNTLYPYGMPDDVGDAVLPAWGRRVRTMFDQGGDPAYATTVTQAMQTLLVDWEQGGQVGKKPTMEDAKGMADKLYQLRAISGFVSPLPINPESKYQFYIDQYREYQDKFGQDADQKFYDEYGPDFFRFAASSSRVNTDMPPTELAAQAHGEYKDLFEAAPLLGGVLAGPGAQNDEYNYGIYRWQLGQPIQPGSSTTVREKLSPEEVIKQNNVDRGWIEYGKLSAAIDVELQRRGLVSLGDIRQEALETTGSTDPEAMEAARESLLDNALQTNMAADLRAWKAGELQGIGERNEGWEDAYNSRSTEMASFLTQAREVINDERLDGRPDIEGLREYMQVRDKVTTELLNRESMGGSGSLMAEDNVDLAVGWYSWTRKLVNQNLLFGEVFHRYLEHDDLESARYGAE